MKISAVGIDRCVVDGGQAQLDDGDVVRLSELSTTSVNWLGGHRTSLGAPFRSLTSIEFGDAVRYRGRTYTVVDYQLLDRTRPATIWPWADSSTPSVLLQTSQAGTFVHVWRAIDTSAAPTPPIAPLPPAPTSPPPPTATPTPMAPSATGLSGPPTYPMGRPTGVTLVEPTRLVDTRLTTPFVSGERRVIDVPAAAGVPEDTTVLFLNATVLGRRSSGYLVATECDSAGSGVASITWVDDAPVANLVTARVQRGQFCIEASAEVDLILDLVGFGAPKSVLGFEPLAPKRIVDTRDVGSIPLSPGVPRRVQLPDRVAVGAAGVQFSMAAIGDGDGYVAVHPCGQAPGTTATLQLVPGIPIANLVMAPIDAQRSFCVSSTRTAYVIIDVIGQFVEGGAKFQPVRPIRLVDSRVSTAQTAAYSMSARRLAGETSMRFPASGWRGIPADAALALNVTTIGSDSAGFMTVWRCASPRPFTSIQNPRSGAVIAAAASVAADEACVYVSATTHVIIDLFGVWTPASRSSAS